MSLVACVRACWLCAVLSAVSAQSENIVYGKLGDTVVLTPAPVTNIITRIRWTVGRDLAMVLDPSHPNEIRTYRQFADRGNLNTSNGEMTISGLTLNDSNNYTVEINDNKAELFDLKVINPVPVPTVSRSCHHKTSCVLTCDGETTGAEPVTYKWMSDDTVCMDSSTKQHQIKGNSSSIKQFSCVLENPVSRESSQPIKNPLYPPSPEEETYTKIFTGGIVFICLLFFVLLLAFIHRCKTGEWFYNKESMPWQGDFWRKENISAAHQENQTEEPLTKPNSNNSGDGDGLASSEM